MEVDAESTLSPDQVEQHAARVREAGWTIVPDVIPLAVVETLTATVDRLMDELEIPFGANNFLGEHTRRIFNLLAKDPVFQCVPVHPDLFAISEAVLGRELLLSSLTAIEMQPGETDQPIHADDASYGLPKPHIPITCVALWALTDFTGDNGGTRIVPGSVQRERSPKRGDVHEAIAVEMAAGSAVVYNGSLWHGGGANRSDERRLGIVSNYCAGFVRQEECQLLAVPRELVAGFEPRLRALVGYGTYRGLIGHVDQQDPAVLIDSDVETDMVWRRIGS